MHTPGPWRHEPDNINTYLNPEFPDAYCGAIMGDDNMVVAVVIDDETPGAANARLIAAAPELLEALDGALAQATFEKHAFRPWQDQARAAIAKATGD